MPGFNVTGFERVPVLMTGPRSSLSSPHQTPTRWSRGLRVPPWTCSVTTRTEITSLSHGSRPTRPPRGPSSAILWIGECPLPSYTHGDVPEACVTTDNLSGCVSRLVRAPPFLMPPRCGLTWVVTGQYHPVRRASCCLTASLRCGIGALLPGLCPIPLGPGPGSAGVSLAGMGLAADSHGQPRPCLQRT